MAELYLASIVEFKLAHAPTNDLAENFDIMYIMI